MVRRGGFTAVEVLVALALAAGLVYMAGRTLVSVTEAGRAGTEAAAATSDLAQGLVFLRERVEQAPVLVTLGTGQGALFLQKASGPFEAQGIQGTEVRLVVPPGVGAGDYLVLLSYDGKALFLPVRGVRSQADGYVVEGQCDNPIPFPPQGTLVFGAKGLRVERQGDGVAWSLGGEAPRQVMAGLAGFEMTLRYREGGVGEVRDRPLPQGGAAPPSLLEGGKRYLLSEVLLYARAGRGEERDLQVAARLLSPDPRERPLSLDSCRPRRWDYTTYLSVLVEGLPEGASARVRVEGPGGFLRDLTESWGESLDRMGTYTVTAQEVVHGGVRWRPRVEGSPVEVRQGGRYTVRVVYQQVPTGTLRVRPLFPRLASGVVQGSPTAEALEGGRVAASGTLSPSGVPTDLAPQVERGRTYRVQAGEFTLRYGAAVHRLVPDSPREVFFPEGEESLLVEIPYRCPTCPATLRLTITWAGSPTPPSGLAQDFAVRLQGPDGQERRYRTASGTVVTTQGSGPWSLFAPSATINGTTWMPTLTWQGTGGSLPPGGSGAELVGYPFELPVGADWHLRLDYAAPATLRVEVSGLPASLDPRVRVLQGARTVAALERRGDFTPDQGGLLVWEGQVQGGLTYTVNAERVLDPGASSQSRRAWYLPRVSPSSVYLGPGNRAVVRVVYERRNEVAVAATWRLAGYAFERPGQVLSLPFGHGIPATLPGGWFWQQASPRSFPAQALSVDAFAYQSAQFGRRDYSGFTPLASALSEEVLNRTGRSPEYAFLGIYEDELQNFSQSGLVFFEPQERFLFLRQSFNYTSHEMAYGDGSGPAYEVRQTSQGYWVRGVAAATRGDAVEPWLLLRGVQAPVEVVAGSRTHILEPWENRGTGLYGGFLAGPFWVGNDGSLITLTSSSVPAYGSWASRVEVRFRPVVQNGQVVRWPVPERLVVDLRDRALGLMEVFVYYVDARASSLPLQARTVDVRLPELDRTARWMPTGVGYSDYQGSVFLAYPNPSSLFQDYPLTVRLGVGDMPMQGTGARFTVYYRSQDPGPPPGCGNAPWRLPYSYSPCQAAGGSLVFTPMDGEGGTQVEAYANYAWHHHGRLVGAGRAYHALESLGPVGFGGAHSGRGAFLVPGGYKVGLVETRRYGDLVPRDPISVSGVTYDQSLPLRKGLRLEFLGGGVFDASWDDRPGRDFPYPDGDPSALPAGRQVSRIQYGTWW